jgi:hypothetical protein
MEPVHIAETTMIVAAFNTIAKADRAVRELREAGFGEEQIGVVCSANCRARHFPDVASGELRAAAAPGSAIAAGGAVGGAVGGLALATTALIAGGLPLVAAGVVLVGGGALAGTFAGAMASLGYDEPTMRYCERLVAQGKILVNVHDFSPANNLPMAQQLMEEAGASEVVWVAENV